MVKLADGKVTYEVRSDDSNLDNDLNVAQKKVEKSAGKLSGVAATTATAVGASFLAVGAAAVGVGVAAVNSANNMDVAMNSFIASTGKGADEADRYQGVLEEIYANNYGDSFADIAESMAAVTKSMGELNDADLQSITESAYALRDTFEYDIPESTRAAKALMTNFGTSGQDAMSMIAAGAQNGLDFSGELLDSISEYSGQFAKVGLNADDMFKIFQSGADTGAWNLDKMGDAVKEFAIRSIDGSKTTATGFAQIGLNADEMAAKFGQGGEAAKTAFDDTINALAAMQDPLAQSAAGVALFGTQWEDLGPDVITQLAGIESGAYDAKDAMDGIKKVKYDDMGSMLEGLTRSLELLLLPLGEELIPVITEVITAILPFIQEILPKLIDYASNLFGKLMPVIEQMLPLFIDFFMGLYEQMLPIVEQALPILIELFTKLIPPLMEIISALLPPLLSIISALLPILSVLIEVLLPIIDIFIAILGPIIDLINLAIVPLIDILAFLIEISLKQLASGLEILREVFTSVFGGISGYIQGQAENIKGILSGIIDFVKNVFTGNWAGAWENVKDIFSNIASGIGAAFKFPLNIIVDGMNGFINGINKIDIPDWVPGVGGKGINLPNIPRLKIGMDYVPSDYFPAYLDKGEAVLTAGEAAQWRSGNMQNLAGPTSSLNSQSINVDSGGLTKEDMLSVLRTFGKESNAGDVVLQVDSVDIARASNKGNIIIDTRYGK